jgi:purine-binding chemotaxis protein CheW
MNDLTPGTMQTMPGGPQAVADNPRQFITFTLDAQEYGVDIMRVREIKGWTDTTTLPRRRPMCGA